MTTEFCLSSRLCPVSIAHFCLNFDVDERKLIKPLKNHAEIIYGTFNLTWTKPWLVFFSVVTQTIQYLIGVRSRSRGSLIVIPRPRHVGKIYRGWLLICTNRYRWVQNRLWVLHARTGSHPLFIHITSHCILSLKVSFTSLQNLKFRSKMVM